MKNTTYIFYTFFFIFIFLSLQSCMKMEDASFKVRIIDSMDGSGIQNMDVSIKTMKPSWSLNICSKGTEIDSFVGKTDSNGELVFFIEDYDRDDYSYVIIVNNFDEVPADYGGFGYGKYGDVLEYHELNEIFTVKLGRIIFP